MRKYEITDITKTITINGREVTLHRIRCTKDFSIEAWNKLKVVTQEIHAGDFGGWVENEGNLSQDGNCWISKGAIVCGKASVTENAYISGRSFMTDRAKASGNAKICVGSRLFDDAEASDNVWLYGFTTMKDRAKAKDNAHICSTTICDDVVICDDAYIDNHRPAISGNRVIGGKTKMVFQELFNFGLDEPTAIRNKVFD